VALVRHGGDLGGGPAALAYGVGLLAVGVAGGWILVLRESRGEHAQVPSGTEG
jgi:hypothetical protein